MLLLAITVTSDLWLIYIVVILQISDIPIASPGSESQTHPQQSDSTFHIRMSSQSWSGVQAGSWEGMGDGNVIKSTAEEMDIKSEKEKARKREWEAISESESWITKTHQPMTGQGWHMFAEQK